MILTSIQSNIKKIFSKRHDNNEAQKISELNIKCLLKRKWPENMLIIYSFTLKYLLGIHWCHCYNARTIFKFYFEFNNKAWEKNSLLKKKNGIIYKIRVKDKNLMDWLLFHNHYILKFNSSWISSRQMEIKAVKFIFADVKGKFK